RQVLKSLIAHIRQKFNVSVAEVDENDIWRRALVGVVVVSNAEAFSNAVLSSVVTHVESDFRVMMDTYSIEML
ncbi:MAG: DUF503 domain-containing protein, partial [Armatimonadetes bacterium]|nr:DUF503 domain-containing protein [Armatimonadota bacterium]